MRNMGWCGGLGEPSWGFEEAQKGRTKDKEGYINFAKGRSTTSNQKLWQSVVKTNIPPITYSALPDFRSKGGMWRRKGGGKMGEVYKIESLLFCPREKAHISCF